ncbi:uncharacterized protein LOC126622556 [Malus sylvestris]|uniref:uncharacterized protein n=1 Tax=Malus domestica TaxID=3750 RepID=UPI0007EDD91B|nr:uncharacterized protein LOC108173873 [Malus domestica]XP_050147300.1 uncharacterized protein LOC126622556 [Malus sylvestris]
MAGSRGGQLRAPVFNGEKFDFWQTKMKTIFYSHKLLNLVENGYESSIKKENELTEAEKRLMQENVVKDAKAVGIIQGDVLYHIFPRIATQNLLISLPKFYDSIASVIENTKDLETIYAQDVVAILKGYEQRLDRHGESSTEKAFASLNIASKPNRFNGQSNNGKYQKNSKSKGKQWSNKSSVHVKNEANNTGDKCKFCDRLYYGECWVKNMVKCHKCNKIGHIARYCHTNKVVQHIIFAHQVEETGNLFYANHSGEVKKMSDVWYMDSGCSNHMTSREDLLVDIDKNVKANVQVGIGVLVEVAGNGTLVIETMKGRRYIKQVMLVPGLAENLRSVDQMIEHGYFFLFGDYRVDVFNDRSLSNLVVSVK